MSEHQSEPISGESGLVGAGPAAPDVSPASAPVAAQANVESPLLAPEQEETGPKPDAPKVEAPKIEAPKVEAPKVEAPKVEASKPEEARPEAPRFPGKLMIMSPGDRTWNGDRTGSKPEAEKSAEPSGKPRMAAMAAVVALATVAGGLGGALATAGLGHFLGGEQAVAKDSALEASVTRIDADIVALKASVEHTSKIGMSQFNKTSDRLDKVEKAQAEPAAKLAKLSEAVDKLRATPPAAVAAANSVAAKEVTGSVTPPATAAAALAKTEVGRLPTVEGWTLRDVANGGALIESRRGIYEVYAGDPIPGVGRVDAIRKQDGRWVVVTSKGLIVAR
ncbi:hypothetical protein [Bradyrhizobium sp. Ash2021]|uniref:hypothetical protein n=1 Tax=Bradyrhizobium sp. Ash2021 TaxID=2954771 RepID=UPI0028150B71|nr:hypothetical protein [Bradyrhizobium sp. Ash2021]WMT73750.1 hypothetical protein NL528_38440 [Bradyrhizobium sp. Ash2021]